MDKLRVVFCEPNLRMGGGYCYLPLVSGILRAYAETDPALRERYAFAPFIYAVDALPKILAHYEENTSVAAFSAQTWNEQTCLATAREAILWGRKSGTMLVPCDWEGVP